MTAFYNKSRAIKILGAAILIFAGLFIFASGAVFGIWFANNFQITPRGDMSKLVREALEKDPDLSKLLGAQNGNVSQALKDILNSQPSDVKKLAQEIGARKPGGFKFKFREGERLEYMMSASMKGQGAQDEATLPASFDLGGKFELLTESVDGEGVGIINMTFKDTAMQGDMMGTPVKLTQTFEQPKPDEPKFAMPLLAFLNAPIRMKVAPNGATTEIPNPARPTPVTREIPMLSSLEFPQESISPGTQWESRFEMAPPGSATSMRVKLINVFSGYKTIGERVCAVIDQKIESEPASAESAQTSEGFGSLIGLKAPRIDISGNNKIYFDAENGQLVHSEVGLGMHLDASDTFSAAKETLKQFGLNVGTLLGETNGANETIPKDQTGANANGNSLAMDMKIDASISLVDPIAPR